MRIALAAYEFKNGDIGFNLSQIERGLKDAQGKADILCFGECFLQGFDALNWDFENDRHIAITRDGETMRFLERLTASYGVDLILGYFELCGESIYSSCAFIQGGRLVHNYRRISTGWKEPIADGHYREGESVCEFEYEGKRFMLTLCGDMWDMPERFKTTGALIWPVYVNFSLEQWHEYEQEYAEQAALAAKRALLVNPLSHDPDAVGGAFCFEEGRIAQRLDYGEEGLLIVDI